MENPTLLLTFHLDTLELDIDAPDISIEFALSLLGWAGRLLETKQKLQMAQHLRANEGMFTRVKLP